MYFEVVRVDQNVLTKLKCPFNNGFKSKCVRRMTAIAHTHTHTFQIAIPIPPELKTFLSVEVRAIWPTVLYCHQPCTSGPTTILQENTSHTTTNQHCSRGTMLWLYWDTGSRLRLDFKHEHYVEQTWGFKIRTDMLSGRPSL